MDKKLKIGFFIDTFYPMVDGVVTVVDNLATLLSDKCDVTVFTVAPADKTKVDTKEHKYNVVRCKSSKLFFLDYDLPRPGSDKVFLQELNNSDLDLVYFHSPMSLAKYAIKYAKEKNIPIMSHMHSQYKRDFKRATHSKLLTNILMNKIMKVFNESDCAVAVNEWTEELYLKEYGLTCPTRVIYNATNMTPLENIELAKEEINKEYGLSKDEKIFLFVGRINKLKNIAFTIDALKLLNKKYQNFKFLIVGSGKDSESFKKQAKALGIEDKVVFVGRVMDIEKLKKLYARADLFLFPSKYDTDGLVKMEAAAQGTPTVFIDGTGAASSITPDETGFISDDNIEDFADTIFKAITDKALYNKVSKNVTTQVYRTWYQSADEVYKLMLELIGKKNN
ncbi:MAG: glycosyltransferase family 4 protein [Clostridiales bacterium]|nr:glycosyltransferase family 4 protein [Clostridiales bacterium]